MVANNFEPCVTEVINREGGYVDHPADPGSATNMGITFYTLRAWRRTSVTKKDVRNLSREEAKEIYRRNYWAAVRGDELPAGVDLFTFDYGVNSGPITAIKALQKAVGVTADGFIGPKTLYAISQRKPRDIVNVMAAYRLSFYQRLKTWNVFGRGWTNRVKGVKARALQMA